MVLAIPLSFKRSFLIPLRIERAFSSTIITRTDLPLLLPFPLKTTFFGGDVQQHFHCMGKIFSCFQHCKQETDMPALWHLPEMVFPISLLLWLP